MYQIDTFVLLLCLGLGVDDSFTIIRKCINRDDCNVFKENHPPMLDELQHRSFYIRGNFAAGHIQVCFEVCLTTRV